MLNILKATLQDIPDLVALINSAYRGESSKKGWTTEADLLTGKRIDIPKLTQMIQRQQATMLKYNEDNSIIGCVYLEKSDSKMYLGMLTVSPTRQAQGIGKKLLSASEDYAREHHCFAMQMKVISVRTELIDWYERHGYYKTGEKVPFLSDINEVPGQPLEFLILEKQL
jgi:ribosomal protein S18 acetylase RimI-like enzyme